MFFKPHARERGNLLRSDMKRYQRQILSLEPDFFYDDKHENIQAHLEDGTVIPFELKANLDRPGLIAFVRTVIPDASISKKRLEQISVKKEATGSTTLAAAEN